MSIENTPATEARDDLVQIWRESADALLAGTEGQHLRPIARAVKADALRVCAAQLEALQRGPVAAFANEPSQTCALDGHGWQRCAPENDECQRCGANR